MTAREAKKISEKFKDNVRDIALEKIEYVNKLIIQDAEKGSTTSYIKIKKIKDNLKDIQTSKHNRIIDSMVGILKKNGFEISYYQSDMLSGQDTLRVEW